MARAALTSDFNVFFFFFLEPGRFLLDASQQARGHDSREKNRYGAMNYVG